MTTLIKELLSLLKDRENEHLEFKQATESFSFDELVEYCIALANERGGKIILGVTDKMPRKIVGTKAFENIERLKGDLIQRLPLRIEVEEILHPDGRVLAITVPSRPIGMAMHYRGKYLMRAGERLVPMSADMLKAIFNEGEPDYSAEVCLKAKPEDLDQQAIADFRFRWAKKSNNDSIKSLKVEQLLADAELQTKEGVTNATLILFGKREALGRLLSQAEVIFEYRNDETTGPPQYPKEFRQGFFSFYDELWQLINQRNDQQHFQSGLFVWDIPTFNENAIRESILNAISHRDYRMAGSVFIRQYPHFIEISSPGGLPKGITLKNILWAQSPRNRRLAEAFARCGLVERSGQGMNRIFESCIKESKPRPDFTHTDDFHFCIKLGGQVQDQRFLRFLEDIGHKTMATFTTYDFLLIDHIFREEQPPDPLHNYANKLLEYGIIEKVNDGRRKHYILAHKFYKYLGQQGIYTRKKGLDRETKKLLLLSHIRKNQKEGSRMKEFMQILPNHSVSQIQVLLRELVHDEKVHVHGKTNAGRWYPGPLLQNCVH